MNILQVNKFHYRKGGSEAVYLGLSELLTERGHRVIPFSMKDGRNLPSEYDRFFVDNVDYGKTGLKDRVTAAAKIIYSYNARAQMRALLKEVQPDVAHFHIFQHQISPSVFGPLRQKGVPLVLTLHDLKPICPNYKMLTHDGVCERCKGRKFYNCFLNRCSKGSSLKSLINTAEMYFHYAMGYYQDVDKYIAPSRFHRSKMIEYGFSADQVVHIPNYIDATAFSVSNVDKGYGLYFGRLSEEKGLLTLLHALKSCPTMPFHIVGSGPLEESLKRSASELGLDAVSFLGFKSGEELKNCIAGASFTVIPSQCYENCPMSVLESLASGKPVIAARIGGIPELIDDGRDGLTFEAYNADDLAAKMKELYSVGPAARASMGVLGRRKMERDYTPDRHYQQISAVYQEVIKKRE